MKITKSEAKKFLKENPIVVLILVIILLFLIFYIGKHLLNHGTGFVQACKGFGSAIKG